MPLGMDAECLSSMHGIFPNASPTIRAFSPLLSFTSQLNTKRNFSPERGDLAVKAFLMASEVRSRDGRSCPKNPRSQAANTPTRTTSNQEIGLLTKS